MNLKETSEKLRTSVKAQLSTYNDLLQKALNEEAAAIETLQSKECETDHTENSVYQKAHDAYMKAQADISRFSTRRDLLKRFNYDYIPSKNITINTTVNFELMDYTGTFPQEYTMLVVPAGLGNAKRNLLDVSSPVGKAIYKHIAGDIVPYTSLAGNKRIRIKEIY